MKGVEEAVRELIRVVLIAVIPVVYLSLEQGTVDWKAVTLVAVVAALRGVEKYLYETKRAHLPV